MHTSLDSPIPLFKLRIAEKGRIRDIKELVVRVNGLRTCLSGQIVDMGDGVRGIIMGFDEQNVLVLVLGDQTKLRMGKSVEGISEPFRIPVGRGFLGRTVTALGEPCDGLGDIAWSEQYSVLRDSPPITERRPVNRYLATGIKAIDVFVPLAMGQRQLILGDRVTGKTAIGIDAILNQKGRNRICIYCAIGKAVSSIQKVIGTLRDQGALDFTLAMVASDSSPAGEQYLVPYAAASMGDYFVQQGLDVLVVFDDLTKHAWAYRQLSLLLDRPPGREAYPGDIFYVQAQLMERAGCFTDAHGGGSMTFLGIAETLQGDLTGYIPSNLASMCDGQIYMDSTEFAEGHRPAMDLRMSLSILGARVHPPILKQIAGDLNATMARYMELTRLGLLQTGLSEQSEAIVRRGRATRLLFEQGEGRPAELAEIVIMLYGLQYGDLAEWTADAVRHYREAIYPFAAQHHHAVVRQIEESRELTEEVLAGLSEMFEHYRRADAKGGTAVF